MLPALALFARGRDAGDVGLALVVTIVILLIVVLLDRDRR